MSVRILAVALGLGLGLACAAEPRRRFAPSDYPGVLRPAETLGRDVLWRQRVTAVWGDGERRGFDAAVQKSGDTLVVMGFSPAGSMGFALVLRGGAVEVRNAMAEELPFPAEFVLLDVQRAFYPWLAPPAAPPAEGAHEAVVDGERVRETWRDGRLVERAFERIDGEPAGAIVVRYDWTRLDWTVPARAVLENGWFGYRLEIETHAETLLPPPDGAAR